MMRSNIYLSDGTRKQFARSVTAHTWIVGDLEQEVLFIVLHLRVPIVEPVHRSNSHR